MRKAKRSERTQRKKDRERHEREEAVKAVRAVGALTGMGAKVTLSWELSSAHDGALTGTGIIGVTQEREEFYVVRLNDRIAGRSKRLLWALLEAWENFKVQARAAGHEIK